MSTRTATIQNWNKSFTHIKHRAGGVLAERFLRSSLLNIYFRLSGSAVLFPIYSLFLRSEYTCSLSSKVWVTQNLVSDMRRSTFEIGATQLHFVIQIAPRSPFLCKKRCPAPSSIVFLRRKSYSAWCKHSLKWVLDAYTICIHLN